MPLKLFSQFSLSLFLLVYFAQSFASVAQVKDVRMWRSPDNTRVVFDLDKAVEHKVFVLESPHRVVVDIYVANLAEAAGKGIDWQGTPVQMMRSGKQDKDTLRVVFDLSQGVKPRSFLLKKSDEANDRLVIDLNDLKSVQPTVSKSAIAESSSKRNLIIALDAGHGGEDPGAIGPGKVAEKNVVLEIAKALEKKLKATPGYQAVLIRTGDYYVSLQGRRELARKARADLFISIHADAFTSPKANGSSVFALSSRGATSTFAQFLADKENLSDQVGGVSLHDKDEVLSSILVDLSMTHKQEASIDVGSSILREMGKISRLHSSYVELAAFQVLKTPDIPSVLVETGFISNPIEARKLSSADYQNKMAQAIFNGVQEFFNRRAPEDSYIAWQRQQKSNNREYIVNSGDTLSAIAKRHSVSVNSLLSYNNLPTADIRVGQKLLIP